MENKLINVAKLCRELHKEYYYLSYWEWRRKVEQIQVGNDLFHPAEKKIYIKMLDKLVSEQVSILKGEEVKGGN